TQRNSPVQVVGISNITTVSAGGGHSLAAREDGTVYAWGYNRYGELGDGSINDGSNTNKKSPVLMLLNPAVNPPINLHATNVTATSLTLQWAPATAQGSSIVGYEVYRGNVSLGTTVGFSMNVTGLDATA